MQEVARTIPEPPKELKVKEWVSVAHVGFQGKILNFLLRAYVFVLVATLAIVIMQGFRLWGFNLDRAFLQWLGGATVGEIGGLLTLIIKVVSK